MEQVLRVATWTAAALLLLGLVLWLSGVSQASLALHGGLWLLIATPIVRVLMALADYLKQRDWAFVAVTAIVLACLIFPIAKYLLSSPR